ncbi:hypothetical protein C922_05345 [Plasmodium inui San Antonio 1]|uniref:Uncharacterized protein n=1 Tax=Plasmodium inui San Antonio 1 TaxID=1237626 RepID=W7A5A2_9APIC|nr:hypothetical protein C922_05345 [Plasmodium inui San Antonio 1]EUD64279.1 hypothetical protein C922_05345 [Plasmodium inui San Antonio 1]
MYQLIQVDENDYLQIEEKFTHPTNPRLSQIQEYQEHPYGGTWGNRFRKRTEGPIGAILILTPKGE